MSEQLAQRLPGLHAAPNPPVKVLMGVDAVGGVWRYAMDLSASLADVGFAFLLVGFGPQPSTRQRKEAEDVENWSGSTPRWIGPPMMNGLSM